MKLLPIEWQRAREQLVQHDAERVDIGACIDVEPRPLSLLWAHVGRRPQNLANGRHDRMVRSERAYGLRDPEIDERLYADMTGGSDVSTAFEAAVDWERFAATAAARRRALSGDTAKL